MLSKVKGMICDNCISKEGCIAKTAAECKQQKEKKNQKTCLLCGNTADLSPIDPAEPDDEQLCIKCWRLGDKTQKAKGKACLVCGLKLTEKEATENPEPICDTCYKVGEIGET